MFKSDSVREIEKIKRGPGPTFYKIPKVESQKIFNFNPGNKWL